MGNPLTPRHPSTPGNIQNCSGSPGASWESGMACTPLWTYKRCHPCLFYNSALHHSALHHSAQCTGASGGHYLGVMDSSTPPMFTNVRRSPTKVAKNCFCFLEILFFNQSCDALTFYRVNHWSGESQKIKLHCSAFNFPDEYFRWKKFVLITDCWYFHALYRWKIKCKTVECWMFKSFGIISLTDDWGCGQLGWEKPKKTLRTRRI